MTMPADTTQFTDVQVTGDFYDANGNAIPGLSAGEIDTVTVYNGTGGTLTRDTLVYLSGMDIPSGYPKVIKADADAVGRTAMYYLTEDILDTDTGVAGKFGLSGNLDTSGASSAGDPVYMSATAGAFTHTEPTAADAVDFIVGVVKVKHGSTGSILWSLNRPKKIGVNEYQADSVRAAALGVTAGAITASRALVADANGNVAALKTTSLSAGVSGSETLLTALELVAAVKDKANDCTFTIAGEGAHAIVTTIQLKDADAAALAAAINVDVWISDAAGGIGTTVDPTSNTAVAGTGVVLTETGGLTHFTKLKVTTGATGAFTLTTTQTAAHNYYLNVRLPNGVIKSSAVVAHAG